MKKTSSDASVGGEEETLTNSNRNFADTQPFLILSFSFRRKGKVASATLTFPK
jgi:hypothetical protein